MAGSIPASATTDGGLWADARRRLRGNRAALVAGALVVLLVVAALLGPMLSPYAIDHVDWTLSPLASPPSLLVPSKTRDRLSRSCCFHL